MVGFPLTLVLLPFAAIDARCSIALRRALPRVLPVGVRLTIRAIWLSIALAGLVALVGDIEAMT